MKSSRIVSFLVIALLTLAASGCKKSKVGVTPIHGKGPGSISGPGPSPFDGSGRLGDSSSTAGDVIETANTDGSLGAASGPMNTGPEDRATLQADTIYFPLDSSIVPSTEREKLGRVADYLKANPANDLMIEGHCDERGTEGYNQSLGEKRALATREALVELGAPAGNIYTTSYGETRPAAPGTGEDAWGKNRRAEFVVVLPAQ